MKILEILGWRKPEPKPNFIITWEIVIAIILLALIIFVAVPVTAYEMMYQHKIYSGVYIDGVNLGGLTKQQAIDALNRNFDNIRKTGLNFNFNNQNYNLPITAVSTTDPDLAFEILSVEVDDMATQAYQYGRLGGWGFEMQDQLIALLNKAELPIKYALNETELRKSLEETFGPFAKPAQDARLSFENNEVKVLAEADGFVIDYDQAVTDLKKNINLIEIKPITIKTLDSVAQVRLSETEALLPQVREIIGQEKLVFKYSDQYQDKSWEVKSEEYRNWLAFKKIDNIVSLEFNADLIAPKFDTIGQEINVAPQDAKFQMTDNKVTEFKPALPGLELDKDASLNALNQQFIANKNKEITLAVKESEPNNKTADSNTLGIKELIGKGVSNFAGSHTNRIKNIKNAVAHLNGIIIPPGEFSIVDAIGDVTAETGYFPEFVIKGDRTIQEYGGGLCQIGTTVFRAALYSGLPITERRPHSYIVSYYKPIGMDATIYGPHPDLRFLNDTGYNILLQIKIDGTQLTFEFWGTGDGRKVEITDPVLYNRTAQPADRLIENPALKPGAKILKETGRGGADAYFDRTITKSDGTKIEETIRSHYIPWPNIYEVGITPKVEDAPATDIPAEPSTSDSSTAGQSGSANTNTAQ
jgi:vancomycin resistance protein YoaR